MRPKRLVFLLAVLALVTLAAWWSRQETVEPPETRPLDPPRLIAKNPIPPPKLYEGVIPTSGAADLIIMVHMN